MSCGSVEVMTGGTLQGVAIVNSDIIGGTISGATITGGSLNGLQGVDQATSITLMEGISNLPADRLTPLATAVASAMANLNKSQLEPLVKALTDAITALGPDELSGFVTAVVKALAQLSATELAPLATAVANALSGQPGTSPSDTTSGELPTTIVGGRGRVLGEPAAWIKLGDKNLPSY